MAYKFSGAMGFLTGGSRDNTAKSTPSPASDQNLVPAAAKVPVGGLNRLRHFLDGQLREMSPEERREALQAAARERAAIIAADFVRGLRRNTGRNQQSIAEDAGIRRASVSDLETMSGTNGPSLWTLVAIARACDVELELNVIPRTVGESTSQDAEIPIVASES